jgi:hypothetical protein
MFLWYISSSGLRKISARPDDDHHPTFTNSNLARPASTTLGIDARNIRVINAINDERRARYFRPGVLGL